MVINVVSVSGEHFYSESGAVVVIASGVGVTIQSGTFMASGTNVFIQSGVYLASGMHVVADIDVTVSSGIFVDGISGQHVYVESGVYLASGLYVVADIAESGIGVQIQSGAHVQISGQHVFVESGVYLASGLYVVADIAESGMEVQVQSGVFLASGVGIVIQSGLYLASGAVITADLMTEDKLVLYQIANPPNLDKAVNAIRTQQVSGLVTLTGGSVTATLARTSISGDVGIYQASQIIFGLNNLSWAQVVRTRIT